MKAGAQTALALSVGYVLGRRRKLRMTTVLAGAAVTGGLGSLGGTALRRGLKMLSSTEMLGDIGPQLGEIADTVRGDLVDAGKAAALAAVNERIGSFSDTLHDRAESLRNPATDVAEGAGSAARDVGRRAGRATGRQEAAGRASRRRAEPEDADEPYDEDQDQEDEEAGEPDEFDGDRPARPVRRRPARGRSGGSRTRR
jgi:type IV secretory pathway TrbL component